MPAVDRKCISVSEISYHREVGVGVAQTEVGPDLIRLDLGDYRRKAAERFGQGGNGIGIGAGVEAEHHAVTDHPLTIAGPGTPRRPPAVQPPR